MTKIEQFEEHEIVLHSWERACYWCGQTFLKNSGGRGRKIYNQYDETPVRRKGVIHKNIHFEDKWFCGEEHRNEWIYAKQKSGMLMP